MSPLRKQNAGSRQEVYQRDTLMSSRIYQSLLQALISRDLIWQMHRERFLRNTAIFKETCSIKTSDYVCQWIIQRQCHRFPQIMTKHQTHSDESLSWPVTWMRSNSLWLLIAGSQHNNSCSLYCDAFSQPWNPVHMWLWHPTASHSSGSVWEAQRVRHCVVFLWFLCLCRGSEVKILWLAAFWTCAAGYGGDVVIWDTSRSLQKVFYFENWLDAPCCPRVWPSVQLNLLRAAWYGPVKHKLSTYF